MSLMLDTPYFDDGIRSTHFFNGRLLSGEDLRQEQEARRAWLTRFGRALGEGIVHGLEVNATLGGSSATEPTVTVAPGLALNRQGQTLELHQVVEVSLARADKPRTQAAPGSGGFHDCLQPPSVPITGTGLYLLTLAPVEDLTGRAPVSGLGPNTAACNFRHVVEGVRFRLLRVPLDEAGLQEDDTRLRNRVAHLCFGTGEPRWREALVHPFGQPLERYGLLDGLRPDRLTDQEVPLALLHWRELTGLRFVDMGSVRRHPTPPPHAGRWAPWLGARRASEAEAVLLQFQEHLEALLRGDKPQEVRATDHFDYLPPAGVVPLELGSLRGFSAERFLEGLTWRKHVIEGARLEPLLRQSLAYPPIELAEREMLWVYLIRENQQALTGPRKAQPYLVFTSGHLPYQGDARLDVGRVEFAHLALPRPGEEPPTP
ncbi:MAG TPA: hypothetical protein VFZ09_25130 [Archangium sp.]|uniref:hypothetical protein n=1 Tax=Archangium sp. TaxID=1872627 RepID=UPI002E3506B1|nr:hypothetical protein [Archangium sp.]HEX5749537.1 hypothetical protein [Archangium sp.]